MVEEEERGGERGREEEERERKWMMGPGPVTANYDRIPGITSLQLLYVLSVQLTTVTVFCY